MRKNLLSASFGLQPANTHLVRSSRSVSLALIQAKSVSSHGDAVTIVNVHFNYILSVLNSSMLTRLAYRAWRQVLDCKGEDVSSILTLRKR